MPNATLTREVPKSGSIAAQLNEGHGSRYLCIVYDTSSKSLNCRMMLSRRVRQCTIVRLIRDGDKRRTRGGVRAQTVSRLMRAH